jgi:hypothetical protein
MKTTKSIFIILLIVGCDSSFKDNTELQVLESLVNESYEYYNQITLNRDLADPLIYQIAQLRYLAEDAISNPMNNIYYNEFELLAYQIIKKYSQFDIDTNSNSIDKSSIKDLRLQVRFLEYLAINTTIRFFHTHSFTLNTVELKTSQEKTIVNQGEAFHGNAYLLFYDSFNPFKLVLEGDTFVFDPIGTIYYEFPTDVKGLFSLEAEILISNKGEMISLPFNITYEVR